ncbi:MAG: tetratricopeptide repeat-containing glycosyltransferase family protein [Tepidisphaeraceae bacterium]|jgi:tetratricopeptide (TPR) repeat protein
MTQVTIDQAMKRAVQDHEAGRLADAERIYREVLAREPNHPDALHLLGMILIQGNRSDLAIEPIRRAIAVNPAMPHYHNSLGNALSDTGLIDESIAEYRQAIQLKADYAEAYNNLGISLRAKGLFDEAAAAYRQALIIEPNYAKAHNNLGNALRDKRLLDDADAEYRLALRIDPNFAEAHRNLGGILQQRGKWQEAMESLRKAVALEPGNATLRWSYSRILLLLGHWKEGWAQFDARLKAPMFHLDRGFRQPQWDGSDPSGKTILLHAEGGHGDALTFIRFVPQVAQRGAKLILECQPGLVPLFEGMSGLNRVIPRGQPLPAFDWQIPLQSLPHVFGVTPENVPDKVPYLSAPPDRVSHWAARLAGETKLRVGLMWSGAKHTGWDNRTRSVDVFAPLAEVPGVKFFSLQKGDESREPPPQGMDWADVSAELNDFADTAALVQNLDLVISVDTSVAHLAGALAKPVWVLIPFQPDFRWLLDRTDTPWYPTMRLFRQPTQTGWQTPVEQMAQALSSLATMSGSRHDGHEPG